MNTKHKPLIFIGIVIAMFMIATYFMYRNQFNGNSIPNTPSVWIETWYPMDSNNRRSGKFYNDLIKLNDRQYLFIGKNYKGTFDSSIITINK